MIRKVKKTLGKIYKLLMTIGILVVLMLILVLLMYKPVYSVSYKNKFIGYSSNIFDLENSISKALLEGDNEEIYYELEEPVKYNLQLIKRNLKINENLLDDLKVEAVKLNKYYVIKNDGEEIEYFKTYKDATNILIKTKENKNLDTSKLSVDIVYIKDKQEVGNLVDSPIKIANILGIIKQEEAKKEESIFRRSSSNSLGIGWNGISFQKRELSVEFESPIKGPVTSTFQPNRTILGRTSPHTGIDIGRPTGTPVYAAQDGYIAVASYQGAYGNMIILDHGNEIATVYAHLSRFGTSRGKFVKKGELIGYVGSTGRSTGSHLHFEIRQNGTALNPSYYVKFN